MMIWRSEKLKKVGFIMVYGWVKTYGWVSVFVFIVQCCLCIISPIRMRITTFGVKLIFNKRENAANLL